MQYPYHSVNGVSLVDEKGRWEEDVLMPVLPSFPGLKAAQMSLKGKVGTRPAAMAPRNEAIMPLSIRVNPVNDSGMMASDHEEARAFLFKNMETLFMALGLGAGEVQTNALTITRHLSSTDTRTATGRVQASAEPEHIAHSDTALLTMFVTVHGGVWKSPTPVTNTVAGTALTALPGLAGSTAAIDDALVAIVGPAVNPSVVNAAGTGFKLTQTLAAGQWVLVNTAEWGYSVLSSGSVNFGTATAQRKALSAEGKAHASALTLSPTPSGVRIQLKGAGVTGSSQLQVRAYRSYY